MPKERIPVKFPGGYRGIILQAHNERVQDTVFLPTDGILVAVNDAGDPEMGTVVVDLTEDNEMASDRAARLQTAWRVVRKPLFQPNSLALQLNQEGQGKGFGGYVIDTGDGSDDLVLGRLSSVFGGPIAVGGGKDKHFQGKDADGHAINPAHITTRALFRRDNAADGPLRFETQYEEGKDGNFKIHPVHLGWTGVDWAWWVKVDMGITPTNTTTRPLRPTTPGGTIFNTPVNPLSPGQPGNGGGGGGGGGGAGGGANTIFNTPLDTVAPTMPSVAPLPVLEMCNEMASPGLLARAQTSNPTKIDLAHLAGAFTPQAAEQMAQTPISGQIMAFGAQGGEKDTNYPGEEVRGASGDPWMYTQKPKKSKFYGGTCPGGFVVLPPEVVAGDAANGYAPPKITRSTVYFVTGPKAFFGAGVPDVVDGGVNSGWSWGMDESTGDLLWRQHVAGEDPVTALKFELSTGDFFWKSGTSFWGSFVHTNTANREYVFPDAAGLVLVADSFSNDVTGAGASLAGIGGGPSGTTQTAWLRVNYYGTSYWVPAFE